LGGITRKIIPAGRGGDVAIDVSDIDALKLLERWEAALRERVEPKTLAAIVAGCAAYGIVLQDEETEATAEETARLVQRAVDITLRDVNAV